MLFVHEVNLLVGTNRHKNDYVPKGDIQNPTLRY